MGLYNALQYLALHTSSPINVTLVAASTPIWMLLVGRLFFPSSGVANEAVISALTSGQSPEYRPPTALAEVWKGVLQFRSDTVIAAGLMLLIALPIFRVAFTTMVFFHERDWAFFVITLIVLSILLSGILLGRAL